MGKKKQKTKKKCCGKYLKSGSHCKACPLLNREETGPKNKSQAGKKGKKKK